MPPRYCDLEPFMPECLEGVDEEEEEKCKKGDNTKRCRWATKCDNEEYKDVPNCQMINPCQADPSLCLNICDNVAHKNTLKC